MWGSTHKTATVGECCEACSKYKPLNAEEPGCNGRLSLRKLPKISRSHSDLQNRPMHVMNLIKQARWSVQNIQGGIVSSR